MCTALHHAQELYMEKRAKFRGQSSSGTRNLVLLMHISMIRSTYPTRYPGGMQAEVLCPMGRAWWGKVQLHIFWVWLPRWYHLPE